MSFGAFDSSEFESVSLGVFVLLAGMVFSVVVGFGAYHPNLLCLDSCRRHNTVPIHTSLFLG